jgi:hypothetical protein
VAVAGTAAGTDFVAFRNSDEGHRDIWIARAPAGAPAFEAPVPVTSASWSFEGCPHDGPALALGRDRLHVAWMDGHTGRNRIYTASAPFALPRFSPRELSPGSDGSQGHPRLIAGGDGSLHAVWDENLDADEAPPAHAGGGHSHSHGAALSGSGRAIMYATTSGSDEFGPALAVAPRAGVFQLNPAAVVGPDGQLLITWNELGEEGKQVVVVRLDRDEHPGAVGPD